MKGLFITFEGIEGSGKTTQAERLRDYVRNRGYPVVLTREPGGTEIAEKIRKIILDKNNMEMLPLTELFLYLASRVQHTQRVIKPALLEGKIVISDRYSDATTAYQGYGRGIQRKVIKDISQVVTGGLVPNLTFLIDIAPEIGFKRMRREDRLEQEGNEFYNRVRAGYLQIARENPERVKVIDGTKSVNEIAAEISSIFDKAKI
jgi:dTMP kinase